MTYSPDHVADGQRLIDFLHVLERDAAELRQLVAAVGDAATARGRRGSGADAGGGRQAASGPSRPTEAAALDERRADLQAELHSGAQWLPYAIAAVRGVTASMDRALARWEGEDGCPVSQGEIVDHHNGSARD
ncbi:DUF7169 domain-containing protein [Streptomyces griseofuscus]|uniref:DUF7169 domain-containing protein n=1 Tax=Streptomyces griseofuscus TaxID=146922 RepID=UPI003F4D3F58